MNKLKTVTVISGKIKSMTIVKNQPNGNKLRTYRVFKICYEREIYLFVDELSKGEFFTFAKLP